MENLSGPEALHALAKAAGHQPESLILRQVREYLQLKGWDVTRHQQGPLCRRGFPDLTAIRDGRTIYIECKTATGRLSAHQEAFRDAIEAHGAEYIVARCLEDVVDL